MKKILMLAAVMTLATYAKATTVSPDNSAESMNLENSVGLESNGNNSVSVEDPTAPEGKKVLRLKPGKMEKKPIKGTEATDNSIKGDMIDAQEAADLYNKIQEVERDDQKAAEGTELED